MSSNLASWSLPPRQVTIEVDNQGARAHNLVRRPRLEHRDSRPGGGGHRHIYRPYLRRDLLLQLPSGHGRRATARGGLSRHQTAVLPSRFMTIHRPEDAPLRLPRCDSSLELSGYATGNRVVRANRHRHHRRGSSPLTNTDSQTCHRHPTDGGENLMKPTSTNNAARPGLNK